VAYSSREHLTTSTGEPTQTAKKPAPRPEKRWVTTSSLNPGSFKIVCAKKKFVWAIEGRSHGAIHQREENKGGTEHLLDLIITCQLSSVDDSVACYIWS